MSKQQEEPKKRLFPQISSIAFNADGSQAAVCPGTKEIYIYLTNGSEKENEWTEIQELKEHSMEASTMDWNHTTNMIVSGSID